ncbi:sugar ABC transporter permease [Actinopolymorpha pittospori]|uniref:Alpha-glucoside transport system permease protein n=1 Tax=Actinopolymorpha pittospori TaxID=648752 RepID=A0A927N628_9ACTN|nr:sugar ABC transporter permease [Actinopolymorpha pittospori]MBE1610933.1 alpha-glucoside transport system permease protein [Actinopolymorpha pittospori]
MPVETHRGLRLEVTSRRMSGPLVPGGRPNMKLYGALLVTAVTLMLVLLVVPTVWTGVLAFSENGRPSLAHFASVFTDPGSLRAFLHTGIWLLIAGLMLVVGFGLAVLSQQHFGRWSAAFVNVMMLPFGLSALASGAAFRIIFDPAPERGSATALTTLLTGSSPVWLGPNLIWLVLISAFAWTWLGFVVSLYRAGLEAIPREHIRRARAQGSGGWLRGMLNLQWRLLRPVTWVVLLTLCVAAARIFDLVLIVAPGPMQDEVNVVSVHWWRLATSSADQGPSAAVAVVLLAGVAGVALLCRKMMRQPHSVVPQPPRRPLRHWPRRGVPLLSTVIGLAVSLLWAFPMFVLVVTAVRSPDDAGAVGWWRPATALLSTASLAEVLGAGLPGALWSTLIVAGGSALIVASAALVPAYALAAARHRALVTALTIVLSILAVLPVQMYVGPLRQLIDGWGLSGRTIPLILMHAAAGLPFAILLLRGALASAAESRAGDTLGRRAGSRTDAARHLWRTTGRALVAVAVLEFVLVWDDFIVSFLVSGPGSSPLTLVLWGEARQFGISTGPVAAAAVLSALVPAGLLMGTWRRWVVPGLTGGVFR